MASEFFKTLYTSQGTSGEDELLDTVKLVIIEEINRNLPAKFTKQEVRSDCKQTHPTKAHRLDGMPSMFCHKFWSIIGTDVVSYCLDVLNNGLLMDDINKTFIFLIPKVKNLEKLAQFKPISLCNVLYKIITKTIVNRWKLVLPRCISKTRVHLFREDSS